MEWIFLMDILLGFILGMLWSTQVVYRKIIQYGDDYLINLKKVSKLYENSWFFRK